MKLIILTALILFPLASVFHYQPKEKPQVNRLAQERRVWELRDLARPDFSSKRESRLPSPYPAGYPSDPDCMTSGYEPGEDR